MSAAEESLSGAVGLGAGDGKCTRDGSQPSVGGATRSLVTLPHLAYGDAVHAALVAADLAPDVVEAGVRTEEPGGFGELFLTVSWLPGHPLCDPVGLDLLWSHLTGWSVRADGTVRMLFVDGLAAPGVLAEVVLHLVVDGPDCGYSPPPTVARWEHADALDPALEAFTDRGADW